MKTPKIKELPVEFEGRGEMKGFHFKQLIKNPKAYLYEVTHPDTDIIDYEVFNRRVYKPNNREIYPRGESFGYTAWSYRNKENALKKLQEISV